MPLPTLDIVEEQGVTFVSFADPAILDTPAVAIVSEKLLPLIEGDSPPRIVVDLSSVRFLASLMLGTLIKMSERARAAGGKFVICGLRADLGKVFKITHLDEKLTFAEDRDQALSLAGAAG